MHQVEYATLNYYKDVLSEEYLPVGVIFHDLSTGKREFRYISDFKYFQIFDEEADVDFVKQYLAGVKQQVEGDVKKNNFSIKDFSKMYVNTFLFSDCVRAEVDEKKDYILEITKNCLEF